MMHPVIGAALVLFIRLMVVLLWSLSGDLNKYGGHIELHYVYLTTQAFSFDLCNVINCKGL